MKPISTVKVGAGPHGLRPSADGRWVYVANVGGTILGDKPNGISFSALSVEKQKNVALEVPDSVAGSHAGDVGLTVTSHASAPLDLSAQMLGHALTQLARQVKRVQSLRRRSQGSLRCRRLRPIPLPRLTGLVSAQ